MDSDSTKILLKSKLKSKERLFQLKLKQYEAESDILITTQSASDYVVIEAKLSSLEEEIKEIESEIKKIKDSLSTDLQAQPQISSIPEVKPVNGLNGSNVANLEEIGSQRLRSYDSDWQGKIHLIDYRQSRKIFEPVLNKFEGTGGSALFFLQKSASMGGEWCIHALRDHLDRLRFNLAPRHYTFGSYDVAEPEPFLNYLASIFNLERNHGESLGEYSERINESIWNSLYAGKAFFLQVHIKCEIPPSDTFIYWFVKEFWHNLCQPLNPDDLIRLVGILAVDVEVPKEVVGSLQCTKSKFDGRKLLPLPLSKWQKDEIKNWLISHSSLTGPPTSLDPVKLGRMASSIYGKSSSGQPDAVYSHLMSEMSNMVG